MGISCLSIRGDSQLTAGQAEGVKLSLLMKAYVGEVRKLECHFNSLKLKHVPRGQDAAVKELSRIAAKGLLVPVGAIVWKLSQPSATPEDEEPGAPPTSGQGLHQLRSKKRARLARQANGASCPLQLAKLAEK
jgi:hypothetical protein